jgi:hypothetical protein
MGPRTKPQPTEPRAPRHVPPEAHDADAGELLDVDGEAYLRWLETGDGPDPTANVPEQPPRRC